MLVNRVVREVSRNWVLKRSVRKSHDLSAKDITQPFRTTKWQGRAYGLAEEIE